MGKQEGDAPNGAPKPQPYAVSAPVPWARRAVSGSICLHASAAAPEMLNRQVLAA